MNEFWAALVGAVVGSLVSGCISYWLQRSGFNEQRLERQEQEKNERRALGHSLFFKILSITNNLTHIKAHVDECVGRAAAADPEGKTPPVAFLLPLMNVADPVQLDPKEMSMLLASKEDEVFNRVLDIPPIYNSILPAWKQYAAMRAELHDAASTTIDLETGEGPMEFPSSGPTAIRFFEANGVAQRLIERAVKDHEDASETLDMLLRALNEKAGTGIAIAAKNAVAAGGNASPVSEM